MNIKLEQYKIFNEAASTLSFSLAARNLFISQSAVSQAIHTLEKELNTQLFIRQSKGVLLTKEGKLLAQKISAALALITSAENQIVNQHELTKGELTIGAGDTLSENYIMPYLVKFNKLYPQVIIKMVNRTSLESSSKNASKFMISLSPNKKKTKFILYKIFLMPLSSF